jgi:hypothetical protein
MSRDPANDARLAREARARQQAFREQGERASAKIREEAKAAAANREYIERMRSNDRRAAQSNHSSYGSPQSYSTPSNGETAPHHGSGNVGGSGSIARVVKTLFVVGALYGAYDGIENQSSIGESAEKTAKVVDGISNALGNRIKSVDPASSFIAITDDIRWAVGLVVSLDVAFGAGAGNAVVLAARQGAKLINSSHSAGSAASAASSNAQ